jgi:hypothetical protein
MIFDELKQRAQSPELWTGNDLTRLHYLIGALGDAKEALQKVNQLSPQRSQDVSMTVLHLTILIHRLTDIEDASVRHKVHLESMTCTTPPNTH